MMTASCGWPDWLQEIWAKSPKDQSGRGETLAEHTWHVLSRVSELVTLRPDLPRYLEVPSLWRIVTWAAFLHDWGKAARAFQQALRGGERWPHRHEVLSLAFLAWLEPYLDPDDLCWIAVAIAFHHKDIKELQELYPSGLPLEYDPIGELPAQLEPSTVEGLWRWLHELGPQWFEAAGLSDMFPERFLNRKATAECSLQEIWQPATLRKWFERSMDRATSLASGQWKGLRIIATLLRGYLIQSDHVASAHQGKFVPLHIDTSYILAKTNISPANLYPHQEIAAQARNSAVLIAPTGSGKTESALLWLANQAWQEQWPARAVYLLPYQASMNAMHARLEHIFPQQVGLIHGRSTLAIYRRLMDQSYSPTEASQLARLHRDLNRLHLFPIHISSPYHMLKAFFQLKGYEAMLADYAQACFIVDEVHAYEPQRLAMIFEAFRFLRNQLGAKFLVMSATLPSAIQEQLAEILEEPTFIRATPELFQRFTRHQLHLLPGDLMSAEGYQAIWNSIQGGYSTLVACNTVARAQQVYLELKERIGGAAEVLLLHGRFTTQDRLEKEQLIMQHTRQREQDSRPVLLIATQVIEVSLNLDFDTIFSDPAPLEALIQRFGRVNRRRRVPIAPVHVFREPADGCGIYDPTLVQSTLDLLQDGMLIHEAFIQQWLDLTYSSQVLSGWKEQYNATSKEFRTAFIDRLYPFQSDESLEEQFVKLFDGTDVLPASLQEEYERLKETRPLEANTLLVQISWRQWHMLKSKNRVRIATYPWPPLIDAPYSRELGLQLTGLTPLED
jgi:CRISPR-associated endonuclease/helicase Cas3